MSHSAVKKMANQRLDTKELQELKAQKALAAGSEALAQASETELAEDIRADQQTTRDSESDEASKKDSIYFTIARYARGVPIAKAANKAAHSAKNILTLEKFAESDTGQFLWNLPNKSL